MKTNPRNENKNTSLSAESINNPVRLHQTPNIHPPTQRLHPSRRIRNDLPLGKRNDNNRDPTNLQIYPEKFHLNTQQVGLQFLGVIIGSVIGEQIAGFISDQWMWRAQKRAGKAPEPEFRLWLSYIGHALTVCGVVVFAVMIEQAEEGVWTITPVIGAGIASAGNQIVTTINITYAVDCYRAEAASVGGFMTFVRQAWGFIGPFWYVLLDFWMWVMLTRQVSADV